MKKIVCLALLIIGLGFPNISFSQCPHYTIKNSMLCEVLAGDTVTVRSTEPTGLSVTRVKGFGTFLILPLDGEGRCDTTKHSPVLGTVLYFYGRDWQVAKRGVEFKKKDDSTFSSIQKELGGTIVVIGQSKKQYFLQKNKGNTFTLSKGEKKKR